MEKLVRDLVPEVMRRSGVEPVFRLAARDELARLLCAKLREEAMELEAEPGAAELGDLVEVVQALQRVLGITDAELESARSAKEAERGGFNNGVVLQLSSNHSR